MSSEPFILGVNYWPRRKAMYWWSNFEEAEVRQEFALIRDLGLTLVRIFLLWDDWQPAPDSVNLEALDNLGKVVAAAADSGLQLDVTFFTGHMSGPNWAPGWMLLPDELPAPHARQLVSGGRVVDCAYRNPYADPLVVDAAELLVRTVVERLKGNPAVGVWNLGNEPDLFAWPPDAVTGRDWVRRMTGLIHELDPGTPVTCGLHTANLLEDNNLRVHEVFSETDLAVMHGYPMYVPWANGPLDVDFVPYLCALTSALSGKPTLMEEFGGCTVGPGEPSAVWQWQAYGQERQQFMASETALAAHIDEVLPRLVEVGATGAVVWCFADYAPDLWDRPPCLESRHERFFGLVRPDGSLKPHAESLRNFAASKPVVRPAERLVTLDVTPEQYYENPLGNAYRLYQSFARTS